LARTLRLAVLDQSPIAEGGTGAQALRNSIDLAQLAEELGYGRYWVAEHHGTPMLACSSPEIMVGAIAAATSRIRVGSGGVMLPHYSPYKVAETFSVLGGLYGKRIDLGVGRAPGTDLETMTALQRDRRQLLPDDFVEQLTELLAYFEDGFPPDHPFARLTRLPGAPGTARPELEQIVAEYGADELMIHTLAHSHAARRRSYELLAEAFGLDAARTPARAGSKRR
jgi:luciferase family oxidoreductase group 1